MIERTHRPQIPRRIVVIVERSADFPTRQIDQAIALFADRNPGWEVHFAGGHWLFIREKKADRIGSSASQQLELRIILSKKHREEHRQKAFPVEVGVMCLL